VPTRAPKDTPAGPLLSILVPFVRAQGLDPAELLAWAGLTEDDIASPDHRIPLDTYVRLWTWVHEHLPDAGLSFHCARTVSEPELGVMAYAASRCTTFRESIEVSQRFARLRTAFTVAELELHGDEAHWLLPLPPRVARLRGIAESTLAAWVEVCNRMLGPGRLRPRRVAFQHPAPADLRLYHEVFRCPLTFGEPVTRMVTDAAVLDVPLRAADPRLRDYLLEHAQRLLDKLPAEEGLADAVRRLLAEELRGGDPSPARVARRLATSERTLQRRLQAEGTSFAALLDEMRRELALSYLHDPKLAVYEIAWLLGYTDPSTFHRAFRRWTGSTPQAWRSAAA
jgi:AraC-like DNA-binding protein